MSSLMQRILRRREQGVHSPDAPAHAESARPSSPPEPAATSQPGLATGAGDAAAASAAPPAAAAPNGTAVHDAASPGGPDGATAPAGVDPTTDADAGPSFRDRGRLRRRMRFLRRLRELGFRDLGGLVFDQHRFGRPDDDLVRGKLTALAAVDAELRALERALHDHLPITELREPGISACARCGAVIASDARFCSTCGAPAGGVRAIPDVSGPATPATPDSAAPPVAPAPAPPPPAAAAPPADEQPTVATRPVDRPSS